MCKDIILKSLDRLPIMPIRSDEPCRGEPLAAIRNWPLSSAERNSSMFYFTLWVKSGIQRDPSFPFVARDGHPGRMVVLPRGSNWLRESLGLTFVANDGLQP